MVGFPVVKSIEIQSYKGPYQLEFTNESFRKVSQLQSEKTQLIVDEQVYRLYRDSFEKNLSNFKKITIVATEENKNIDKISSYVSSLMANKIKIDHVLVAIGGGIVQDITCFLASTLFRGMKWFFVPTTLLAQADSCIGSKSSINVGPFKNLMGTFTPPERIFLDVQFLNTLESKEIASGVGEILKVHMIKGVSDFESALPEIRKMKSDFKVLERYIEKSLLYKKEMIELDEFDKGPRNVMNYGHSYGHAIESATNFEIPHGIAVTIGMDMANFQSYKMNRISYDQFLNWHVGLFENYRSFLSTKIDFDGFISALQKDKKNTGTDLSLILTRNTGPIEKIKLPCDSVFSSNCHDFFENYLVENKL
jgi:3-dehydroquinate synthase